MSTLRFSLLLLTLLLGACSSKPVREPVQPACDCPPVKTAPIPIPDRQPEPPADKKPEPVAQAPDYSHLQPAKWEAIDGWAQDNLVQAWGAWMQSCSTLKHRSVWQAACVAASAMTTPDRSVIERYFRQHFNVYLATSADGAEQGLITGYYQPLLRGSRVKTEVYRYPLYSRPRDLITVDLGELYPELAHKRIRGRLIEQKLVPYHDRRMIDAPVSPLEGSELLWVDDAIELFFLQIQGSGIIQLENGERVHVGYADQNGHAYRSIGRVLIERGEITADKASMHGIKDWARTHVDQLRELLDSNPSYVFFRELPADLPGPLGALGVPLTSERSVAIDPRHIPLGAPVFLSTTYPNSSRPLQRLMQAQDTGGAIKGGVRADFYWGAGDEAGRLAGAMKQRGRIWVLLPHGFPLPPVQ